MDQRVEKPQLTPTQPASDMEFGGGGEHRPPRPLVVGSIPSGPAKPSPTRVSAVAPLAEPAEKADAHPLSEAVEAFLLTKQVAGCTQATLHIYGWWVLRLRSSTSRLDDVRPEDVYDGKTPA